MSLPSSWIYQCFHGELDGLVITSRVVQESLQPLWSVRWDHKVVNHVAKPADRLVLMPSPHNPPCRSLHSWKKTVIPQPFHQSAHRTVHTSWTLSSKDMTEWGQDALLKVLIPEVHGVLNQQSDQRNHDEVDHHVIWSNLYKLLHMYPPSSGTVN